MEHRRLQRRAWHRPPSSWFSIVQSMLVIAGCNTQPTAVQQETATTAVHPAPVAPEPDPLGAAHGLYYPLQIGNRWQYDGIARDRMYDDDGNLIDTLVFASEVTRELVGPEVRFEREYILEKESGIEHSPFHDEPNPWVYWHRYRQDPTGLYGADVPLLDPTASIASGLAARAATSPAPALVRLPAAKRAAFREALLRLEKRRARLRDVLGHGRRAGGPLANEWTRLRYPLHTGATWEVRNEPDLVIHAVVEAREVLDLPAGRFPAWRIRIVWDIPDPGTILLWFGSSGYLKLVIHDEEEAVDNEQNPVGMLVFDQTEVLTGLHLIGDNRQRGF